jgi:hypothetical protein
MTQYGTFEGDVVAKWLTQSGDDRDMKLLQGFAHTASLPFSGGSE